jgi:hypothetical protein
MLRFEILDNIICQSTDRFQNLNKLKFVSSVDTSKFKSYQTVFPNEGFYCLSSIYKEIFDTDQLKNELPVRYLL